MINLLLKIRVVDNAVIDKLKLETLQGRVNIFLVPIKSPFTSKELKDQIRSAMGKGSTKISFSDNNPSHYTMNSKVIGFNHKLQSWVESDTRQDLYEHLPIEVQNWLTTWRKEREVLLTFIYS